MKFSENLRALRKEKDYSQEYLAEHLNVSRQTISKWENATAMPDLKKLTEIAELFEIGINELLGLNIPESESSENASNISNIIEVEYTNQKAEAKIAKLTQSNNKNKIVAVINSICIIILSIMLIITNASLSSLRNDFISNINMLSSQIANINTSQQAPAYYEDDNEFTYEIKSINKEKPWLVTVLFSYSPEKISKNADVYFTFTDYDGSNKKIEATMENDKYVATSELDCRLDGDIFICTDLGSEIEKQKSNISLLGSYWCWNADTIDYSVDNSIFSSQEQLSWENVCGISLTDAKIRVMNNGKEVYSKELEIIKSQRNEYFKNTNSRCNVDVDCILKNEWTDITIELTDENNVKYVYSVFTSADSYIDFGNNVKQQIVEQN